MTREFDLYKLLVKMNLKNNCKEDEEFTNKLALAMSCDSCLFIDSEQFTRTRQLGKSTFFAMLARMLNQDKENNILLIGESLISAKFLREKVKDPSINVINKRQLSNNLRGNRYSHIIFDDVSIDAYTEAKKHSPNSHIFGTVLLTIKKEEK